MRLIPNLILLAVGAALPAVELAPRLGLGGHVAAGVDADLQQPAAPGHPGGRHAGENDLEVDFSAEALVFLNARYDGFALRADVVLHDESPYQEEDSAGDLHRAPPVRVEQVFADWSATEHLTVRAGRFRTTWLGWEGFHVTSLWRARHSAAWDWNVQNHSLGPNEPFVTDGVGLLVAGDDRRWGIEGYVADDLLGSTDDRSGTDLATGLSLWAMDPALGRIELGIAHDPRSTAGPDGGGVHSLAADLNADIRAFQEHGWFLAAEAQYHHHPDLTVGGETFGSDLVLLAMANYAFTPTLSATLMVDWVERGFEADDNEQLEVALALLMRPHPRARFHVEANAIDEAADDADSVGASMVVAVDLP